MENVVKSMKNMIVVNFLEQANEKQNFFLVRNEPLSP